MPVPIKIQDKSIGERLAAAMKSGDESEQVAAWAEFHESICSEMRAEYEELKDEKDAKILAQRGYRLLTSQETKFYNALSKALNSESPATTFAEILGTDEEDVLMPQTIIDEVFKNLEEEHPLLDRMNFQYTGFSVRWILNAHTRQKGIWGKITDAIKKNITSAFKVVDIHQNKLSAFAFIELGMLDMGPTFLDAYIRKVLVEAISCGLEAGAVSGSGVDEPIGMDRDIHDGVNVNTTTGYPKKEAVKVTSFSPKAFGDLLANLVKTEDGHQRKFSKVQLICNMTDYLTKIMPATTTLKADGKYENDCFPFPTEVIPSNEIEDGEALIGLLPEYSLMLGSQRKGQIDFTDEFEFLDDVRYFKSVLYGTGRAFDNTSFILLDISELDPLYMTVRVDGPIVNVQVPETDGGEDEQKQVA